MGRTVGWGIAGTGTTMLVRKLMRRAMYRPSGTTRLPVAARRSDRLVMTLLLAAAAGMTLALSDVFKDQRKRNTREGAS